MGYIEEESRELFDYKPELTKEKDFDDFWDRTLVENGKEPLEPARTPFPYGSDKVKVYDVSFSGFDGTRINGWFMVPHFGEGGSYPCLVHYHGYGGNRGIPADFCHWIMQGTAVLSVDIRDQNGITGNGAAYSNGSLYGLGAKGILDKDEYYYRAVYMDCLRALDFVCAQKEVDPEKIILEGGSQGGGIAMAVAALDSRPISAIVNVPSASDLAMRVRSRTGVFGRVAEYLKQFPSHTDRALTTLSYFDTMNMAHRITCDVLASVSLGDTTCPALYYFATYNRITSRKRIEIYPFNGHEGCPSEFTMAALSYLGGILTS